MSDSIDKYVDFWTTDLRHYAIACDDERSLDSAVILCLADDGEVEAPLVIDTDRDVYREIVRRMVAAGVARVSWNS